MDRQQFTAFLSELRPILDNLSPDKKAKYMPRVLALVQKLESQLEGQEPKAIPLETPVVSVTAIAKELWTLARGNPDIFAAYASSYPDRALNAVAANPAELNALIQQVGAQTPVEPLAAIDGIQQSPIQSSTVYGYRYDPLKKRLTVRFNGGQVYRYEGVPSVLFDMFRHGEGVAKTTGSNKWGRWWRSKTPSMGASVHQLLIAGQYPFSRIR